MVEVLCLYDQFFEDTELSTRTQGLPQGVLTVVLDACHAGGMDKVFFPGDTPEVARAKVFQPPPDMAVRDAQAAQQVTQIKFFGREATGHPAALAAHFQDRPPEAPPLPQLKDLGEGQPELNGVLFAACLADETAAAGSPSTNNLSAFTYGLTTQLDPAVSVADLCTKVRRRLGQLAMRQHPVVQVPLAQPGLRTHTFVSMRDATATIDAGTAGGGAPATNGAGTGKEFEGAGTDGVAAAFERVAKQFRDAIGTGSGSAPGKGFGDGAADVDALATALLGSVAGVRAAATQRSVSKDWGAEPRVRLALTDPSQLSDKDFLRGVFTTIQTAAPMLMQATRRQDKAWGMDDALATVSPERRADKEWVDFVTEALETLGPLLVDAVTGRRDFGAAADLPALAIPADHAADAAWVNDALAAVSRLMPSAVAAFA
ncbi:MAG: hypothetical protein QOJ07_1535 [Thermoleophilaceae bacterium]|nr:hypothetical protein [Thermoleophilaceae bacterium]